MLFSPIVSLLSTWKNCKRCWPLHKPIITILWQGTGTFCQYFTKLQLLKWTSKRWKSERSSFTMQSMHRVHTNVLPWDGVKPRNFLENDSCARKRCEHSKASCVVREMFTGNMFQRFHITEFVLCNWLNWKSNWNQISWAPAADRLTRLRLSSWHLLLVSAYWTAKRTKWVTK